ncbi:DUF3885 domain-containing protein [Leisingera sp. S132]|uniref:DUF3885 domain-containing protein n=1 Tax=Leisingera sp. S132 TaxID=2867016 RepID=UPI0021A37A67|nr:DUF3885 domain-containing protein [Leisingera sp. S132]UWQ80709.1 DUF3885 domain-containing protein [Leisingera sp. S132]
MHKLTQRVFDTFGVSELPHGLFYEFDHALRFDLGGVEWGTDRPVQRFWQAFERADTITRAVFKASDDIWALLSCYGGETPEPKRLHAISRCGLPRNSFSYLGAVPQNDEEYIASFGYDLHRHWDAYKLRDTSEIREFLWLMIATDLSVYPQLSNRRAHQVYLVDFETKTIAYPYDDRGMDVVSMDRHRLEPHFTAFQEWLLARDMKRMASRFSIR